MSISTMNGIRIVVLDAPTSRMMAISRRRVKAAWRIVVPMSRVAQTTMAAARTTAIHVTTSIDGEEGSEDLLLVLDARHPRSALELAGHDGELRRVLELHPVALRDVADLEVVDDRAVAHLLLEPVEGLLLGLVVDGLDLGHRLELGLDRRLLRLGHGLALAVRLNGHALQRKIVTWIRSYQ